MPGRRRDRDRPRDGGPPRGRRHSPPPPPPRSDSWRPINAPPYSFSMPPRARSPARADSYRPQPPRGDFTFRVDKPSGVIAEHQLPPRPPPPPGPRADRYRGNNHRDGRGGRGRGRRPWIPPPHLSERALLSTGLDNGDEEQLFETNGQAKFRDLDQMSDDDEQAMEISSTSSQSDNEGPSKKRTKTSAVTDNGVTDAAPKWSNPDPYTALPCPDDTNHKKKDVVALIRKARNEEDKDSKAATEAEDFIALDSSEDEQEQAPPSAPVQITLGKRAPPASRPPPPAAFQETTEHGRRSPSPPRGPLGTRKRMLDDEIKHSEHGRPRKSLMKPVNGIVTPDWKTKNGEDPNPWAVNDHGDTPEPSVRLHKEIKDFYDYVSPRGFEQRIREHLVENLQQAMVRDRRAFQKAKLYAFGSYKSGLYLPTADMDLVVCSPSFLRGGFKDFTTKNTLYKFKTMLMSQMIAEQSTILVIAHARVPLVKYVDRLTGLKVDVSFDSLGGVDAIEVFQQWKEKYPAMPILVALIKHFLLMRGLNEPVNGGIGGFTVICLVVSMFQTMAEVQSRSLIPEHHLGEMLMTFLELYGLRFNYKQLAIATTGRIGYVRKLDVTTFAYKNRDRLSIIDPNNPENDISGGSSNIASVFGSFEEAYRMLQSRMRDPHVTEEGGTILDAILEGNYSSFRNQRAQLRTVHEKVIGPCD